MQEVTKKLAIAAVLIAGLAAAPALQARDASAPQGATQPDTMPMVPMMGQMGEIMMECCKKMMSMMDSQDAAQRQQPNAPDNSSNR